MTPLHSGGKLARLLHTQPGHEFRSARKTASLYAGVPLSSAAYSRCLNGKSELLSRARTEVRKSVIASSHSCNGWLKHHRHAPIAAEDHADHILATFKKAINWARPRSSCRSRAELIAASAAATLSRFAYRRRPTQQLRQLGEVRRRPPRLS